MLTPPDVLSGQDVQQLGHVPRPFSQLHRELTDPVVQHQGSVNTLPHQLQLHVSAAHHYSDPAAETQRERVPFYLQPNGLALLTSLHCQNVSFSGLMKNISALGVRAIFKMIQGV